MMIDRRVASATTGLALPALLLSSCAPPQRRMPVETPTPPAIATIEPSDPALRSTIVGGEAPVPPAPRPTHRVKPGNVRLNFPSADVAVVAKAVLGDMLGENYAIAPGTTGLVSLVTPGPVARSEVFGLLETALKNANLALVQQGNAFLIQSLPAAAANGPVSENALGYGTEIVKLQFINADEAKNLINSVLPGIVTATEPTANAVTIAGTTGQRASANELIRQFDVNWLRNMSFALIVPQRTDSRLIVPELDKLINAADAPTRGLVRILAMDRINGILAISAQRQYLDDVRRWIDILDREGQNNETRLFVYRVQNGRARDLARTLNQAFTGGGGDSDPGQPFTTSAGGNIEINSGSSGSNAGPSGSGYNAGTSRGRGGGTFDQQGGNSGGAANGGVNGTGTNGQAGQQTGNGLAAPSDQVGRITSDDVNNAVIVFGTPRQYAVVEDALRKLDVPPYQVLIEAAISEVTLTDQLRYGIDWRFLSGNNSFGVSNANLGTVTAPATGFSYFFSNNNDINVTLNALEQRTNVKVISAPKVVVLNNQTASLQVGDQVPIQTQAQQSTVNSNSPIVNSIEYRDTGVILKVTPRVNSGGLVLLDIAQEVSDISTRTISGISSPIISTRRISTSIAVQDGQVMALGGLFRNSKNFGKNGIPLLSRIPVIGGVFGNQTTNDTKTELIVLLKPHVIRNVDDGRAVTEELREKLRTLEPFRTGGKIP